MSADRIRELNFAPPRPLRGVIVFCLLFVLPGLFAAGIIVADYRRAPGAASWNVYAVSWLIGFYLVVGYLLLLYVVFGAHRFRFSDVGFRVFSWRGAQVFAWQQVRRAELSCYRYQVELVLFVGRFRRVSVPLTSFGKARSLLDAVRARISVSLVAAPQHLALLEDR